MSVAITMRERRPSQSESSGSSGDGFNAAEALEALHTEIADIKAFAHAAGEAVTHLPHTSNPEPRPTFALVYTLVSKVAADVHACVRHGDKLIAALSTHLQNK